MFAVSSGQRCLRNMYELRMAKHSLTPNLDSAITARREHLRAPERAEENEYIHHSCRQLENSGCPELVALVSPRDSDMKESPVGFQSQPYLANSLEATFADECMLSNNVAVAKMSLK